MSVTDLWNGRLFRFVAICLVAYVFIALATDAPVLILVGNDLLMSAAAGVCIAYAPILPGAMLSRSPTKGDFLGTGIFFVSAGMLLLRLVSVVARDLGYPEVYNTDVVTFALSLCFIGALMHLWAPMAVKGRIPRARWTSTGIVVAVGLLIALAGWSIRVGLHPNAFVQLR